MSSSKIRNFSHSKFFAFFINSWKYSKIGCICKVKLNKVFESFEVFFLFNLKIVLFSMRVSHLSYSLGWICAIVERVHWKCKCSTNSIQIVCISWSFVSRAVKYFNATEYQCNRWIISNYRLVNGLKEWIFAWYFHVTTIESVAIECSVYGNLE